MRVLTGTKERALWNEISKVESLNIPHIVAGDFNCVPSTSYKKGEKPFK